MTLSEAASSFWLCFCVCVCVCCFVFLSHRWLRRSFFLKKMFHQKEIPLAFCTGKSLQRHDCSLLGPGSECMYAAARLEKMSLIGANGLTCRSIQGSVGSPSKSRGAPARIHRARHHHHHHRRRRILHVLCKATAESADQVQSTYSGSWPLKYGAHSEQGPREKMEDMFTVVPEVV